MKKLLCFIFIFHSFYTFSQVVDSIYKKYNSGLLHRSGYSIMKGGDKINFLELAKEFSMSDLGLDQFKLFKRKKPPAVFCYFYQLLPVLRRQRLIILIKN